MCPVNNRQITINDLLEGNKNWVKRTVDTNPEFFKILAQGQQPPILWIGCSDSRIPANEVTDTLPGEIFVHRNIANLIVNNDFNAQSVLYYAVNYLKVKHVIVCGHYGCGGVLAAMDRKSYGFLDNWLRNIKDVYQIHKKELDAIQDKVARGNRLVELNVTEQVMNLTRTSVVQDAWENGQELHLHGMVYAIESGLLQDLKCTYSNASELPDDTYNLLK